MLQKENKRSSFGYIILTKQKKNHTLKHTKNKLGMKIKTQING